ncbi:hypothetical protein ACS127_12375 [Amphibacillus sp. Q70]|uniref:hypothetical protein n=1 Tax=Amphibacillus sp. Q70 TaxID=3453416 RepID=UPI003F85EEA1
MKKVLLFLILAIIFISFFLLYPPSNQKAGQDEIGSPEDEKTVDAFLTSVGMEQTLIDQIPFGQKETIYDTLDHSATFKTIHVQTFSDEDGFEKTTDQLFDHTDEMISVMKTIPAADLTIYVVMFELNVDDKIQIAIYPSFIWSESVSIHNDKFAIVLDPYWFGEPQKNGMYVLEKNVEGKRIQCDALTAVQAGQYGYMHNFPDDTSSKGFYEIHTYMYAIPETLDPVEGGIKVKYTHDTSKLFNAKYDMTLEHYLGYPSEILIEGNTKNLRTITEKYPLYP